MRTLYDLKYSSHWISTACCVIYSLMYSCCYCYFFGISLLRVCWRLFCNSTEDHRVYWLDDLYGFQAESCLWVKPWVSCRASKLASKTSCGFYSGRQERIDGQRRATPNPVFGVLLCRTLCNWVKRPSDPRKESYKYSPLISYLLTIKRLNLRITGELTSIRSNWPNRSDVLCASSESGGEVFTTLDQGKYVPSIWKRLLFGFYALRKQLRGFESSVHWANECRSRGVRVIFGGLNAVPLADSNRFIRKAENDTTT